MAYVDKLVDTQDVVIHDFKGEHHDDSGSRSHKRSGEVYACHTRFSKETKCYLYVWQDLVSYI
jgi:hypothetical protein